LTGVFSRYSMYCCFVTMRSTLPYQPFFAMP
jgi:hypothetical protein